VPDEPSAGELARRLDERFADVRDDIRELNRRLDEKVNRETYDLRHTALMARIATLEVLREKDAERLIATRRWLIGAVVVPLVGILAPIIILLTRGAGS
jgi:hypothetical protein